MIRRFLNKQSKTIVAAAIVLGAASLISRILGLVRARILAGMFGAGDELDVYYAAFRVPDLVYSLLVIGAISAGFIPVFVNYLKKDKDEAWYLASSVLNLIGLSLIIVCSILIIFTPWLVKVVAPGFSQEKLSLTVQMTRIMFLSPIFLGLSAVFGGILQSFRRFLVYALGPIMYNLGIIFGALFLVQYFGLFGLAYGVVLGAFFHMIIQIPTAFMCGFRWRPVFDFKFEGVRRIFKLMPPRVLSLAVSQINFWIMTVLASSLVVGSITVFAMAINIWSFPFGVFGISFVLASFPKLSETAQRKDKSGFVKTFASTARQILFFLLPATALLIVLRVQIVQGLLGTGRFDASDVILTYQTLGYISLALFAEALILLFLRGFFAWEDTKTPLLLGFLATVFRLLAAWYLSSYLGVVGLALGFSLGSILYLTLLFIGLRRKIGFLDGRAMTLSGFKMFLASVSAGLVAYLSLEIALRLINISTVADALIQGSISGILGILVYFFLAWILKVDELSLFLSSLTSRLPWKKVSREINEDEGR